MLWGACHNPKLYFPGFQGLFLMFMDHPIGVLYHQIIHFNLISVCVCALTFYIHRVFLWPSTWHFVQVLGSFKSLCSIVSCLLIASLNSEIHNNHHYLHIHHQNHQDHNHHLNHQHDNQRCRDYDRKHHHLNHHLNHHPNIHHQYCRRIQRRRRDYLHR